MLMNSKPTMAAWIFVIGPLKHAVNQFCLMLVMTLIMNLMRAEHNAHLNPYILLVPKQDQVLVKQKLNIIIATSKDCIDGGIHICTITNKHKIRFEIHILLL